MPEFPEADTIRILVATDNHVGYEERDAIRKDDSWRTFDEIMNLARNQEVDMVLLAGDLFHDNKPSRKSLYQVIRTLRKNCLGMKPCPLEFLSDAATVFEGAFPHVNYEDPDINISIPVFSIHGNHDDPSGDGNYCSLDLLQAAGLVNYFGRVAEADNIQVKPILLQKGETRMALYGLSNVRDERMFRTFRDHRVKWFRPGSQQGDWFNLLAVHQNHHAHTATSYLPENVLPDWLNLVVWGHEHECLIDPSQNPETGFHVMQPGSSVATSLVPGEAVQKHVAIVSVSGKNFKVDKIPLKTVRPFVTREIVLAQDKRFNGLDKKKDNRQEVTRRLINIVEEMIGEANAAWEAVQTDEEALEERPLPLVRLKVEYTAQEGGQFECENPQRFSNRFVGKVANTNDVVYFYRKKTTQRKTTATNPTEALESLDDESEAAKVESLVQQFLSAQSLRVLPQGPFGEAVNQFVSKDDKHAMELFVSEHLAGQVKQMLGLESDDEDLSGAMEIYRARMESRLAVGAASRGLQQAGRRRVLKPKPDMWDSDFEGHWEDEPNAYMYEDIVAATEDDEPSAAGKTTNSRQRKTTSRAATGKSRPATKKPPARRGRKVFEDSEEDEQEEEEEEEEEETDDVLMQSDGGDSEPPSPPRTTARRGQSRRAAASKTPATRAKKPAAAATGRAGASSRAGAAAGAAARSRQTRLNFGQSQTQTTQPAAVEILDDDDVSDDAFDPAPISTRTRRR